MTENDDRLVVVHVCYSRPEAEVAASMLRAAGIPVVIQGREIGSVSGDLMVAIGGMQLLVPALAEAHARRMLADTENDEAPATAPESASFKQYTLSNLLWLLLGVFGIYAPVWLRRRK